jgi:hypothetical protein
MPAINRASSLYRVRRSSARKAGFMGWMMMYRRRVNQHIFLTRMGELVRVPPAWQV